MQTPNGRPAPPSPKTGHHTDPDASAETRPIVVIGGGPAGSTCAHLLARDHGFNVLLLEKDRFPRFHIGESMLPMAQETLARLGLQDKMDGMGFVVKHAGEARVGKSPDSTDYWTTKQFFTAVPNEIRQKDKRDFAWHVERSRFDKMLLDEARGAGVDVHEAARVLSVTEEAEPVVEWRDEHGVTHTTHAAFVVDASGRNAFLARKFGKFIKETNFLTSTVFGQFADIDWPEGKEAGYINTYFLEHGWIWFIPLGNGKTSVGIVMDKMQTDKWARNPEDIFRDVVGRFAYLRDRFKNATQLGPVKIMKNLPYYASEVTGEGWAMCGDAGFFVDPIHSSGMHLSFYSAEKLADALPEYLMMRDKSALDKYADVVQSHHQNARKNISYFYAAAKHFPMAAAFAIMFGPKSPVSKTAFWRAVNGFSFGYYSKFQNWMKVFWGLTRVGLLQFAVMKFFTRTKGWGKHGMMAPLDPDFEIPLADDAMLQKHDVDGFSRLKDIDLTAADKRVLTVEPGAAAPTLPPDTLLPPPPTSPDAMHP